MTPTTTVNREDLLARVKVIMRRDLKLGADFPIADDMPFFGGEADIDSLDILLLLGSVEKEFKIKIPNEAVGKQVFQSVETLANYIQRQLERGPATPGAAATAGAPAADLLSRLPHGPEFRFVTRVVSATPGEAAEGVWAPTGKEQFFAGHFPGNPIVPGVLIAESMAQVAGLAVPVPAGTMSQRMDGKLVQIDVRFEQPIVPPAEILVRAQLTRSVGGLHQFNVTASVGSLVVSRGTLTLSTSVVESAPVGGR